MNKLRFVLAGLAFFSLVSSLSLPWSAALPWSPSRAVFAAREVTQQRVEGNAMWLPQYERFFEAKSEGPLIPGLMEGFVPQGIGYIAEKDWLVMGGYRDGRSSLVTVVDAGSGIHVKTVQFATTDGTTYTGHAGGLALSERHLWISSGEQAHYVPIADLIGADHGDTLTMTGHIDVDARGSFVSYADGVLWVGDFALSPGYPTKPHHHLVNRDGTKYLGWMAGYIVDEETDLIRGTQRTTRDGTAIPDYILSIPNKIQEGTVFGDTIILTESYGRNNISHLFMYDNPLTEPPHQYVTIEETSVPVWFLDKHNLVDTWVLTPMAESLAERNGQFYIIFESAALKYLNGNYAYALDRVQIVDVGVLLSEAK